MSPKTATPNNANFTIRELFTPRPPWQSRGYYTAISDCFRAILTFGVFASGSDRLFSDEVFDAEFPDFNMANAFLLGFDLRRLATNEEAKYVEQFLERFMVSEENVNARDSGMGIFHGQIRALQTGLKADSLP